MLAGIGGVVAEPRNLVSFSVLFGMSQNIGGLLGSAILGTFQTLAGKISLQPAGGSAHHIKPGHQ